MDYVGAYTIKSVVRGKKMCRCDELTSGRCSWCQGIDEMAYRISERIDKEIDESVYTEFLEDEEFDEKDPHTD